MIIEKFGYLVVFLGAIFCTSWLNGILIFDHLGKGIFSKDEKKMFLVKFRHFRSAILKNWYFDYLNLICFFLMMFLFMFLPLVSSWNFNGQIVDSRAIKIPDDLIFIFCCFMFFQFFVYVVNFDNYRKLDVVKFGNTFVTLFSLYFFIIASAVIFYKTYDLEAIVYAQGKEFNHLYFDWGKSGILRLPVAAMLNIFLLVVYQREKNPYFFRPNISGNYAGSFLQKTNFTLYDFLQVAIFVYLFLGGFSLILGFSHLAELAPSYLRFFQVCSLSLKVLVVALAVEIMRILFISRMSVATMLAFEKAAIGIGVISLLGMMISWK